MGHILLKSKSDRVRWASNGALEYLLGDFLKYVKDSFMLKIFVYFCCLH